jgi:hypothetical protein
VTEAIKAAVSIVALVGPLIRLVESQSLALEDTPVSRIVVTPSLGMKFFVGPLMRQDPVLVPGVGVNMAVVQTSLFAPWLINEHCAAHANSSSTPSIAVTELLVTIAVLQRV